MMQLTAISRQDAITLKTNLDKMMMCNLIQKHRHQAIEQVKLQYKNQTKKIKIKKQKKHKKNDHHVQTKDEDEKIVLKDNTIIDLSNVGKVDGIDYNLMISKVDGSNTSSGSSSSSSSNVYKDKIIVRYISDITLLEFRKRRCRLIIRNLSFQATEQNVIDKLSFYGPIVSVELPKRIINMISTINNNSDNVVVFDDKKKKRYKMNNKDNDQNNADDKNAADDDDDDDDDDDNDNDLIHDSQSQMKSKSMGFGFITYLCAIDAEYVVEKCTGLKICNREVAIDFCMAKETYLKFGNNDDDIEGIEKDNEKKNIEDDNDDDDTNVKIDNVVDSKDKDDDDDDDDIDCVDEKKDDDDIDVGKEEDDDDADEDDDEDDDEDEEDENQSKKKIHVDDVNEGCTVFIRGLSFDTEANDLKKCLSRYGYITMAIIVKDKITNISKGSAFVKFISSNHAIDCIEDCIKTNGIIIKDKLCRVNLAIDKESAKKLKENEIANIGKDRRNLYLCNEGLIVPKNIDDNSNNEDHNNKINKKNTNMSIMDIEKRQRAQMEKNKKLQNPLFFVSGCRLSIRNLAKHVTDKELKDLCLYATEQGLVNHQNVNKSDLENYLIAQGINNIETELINMKRKYLIKENTTTSTINNNNNDSSSNHSIINNENYNNHIIMNEYLKIPTSISFLQKKTMIKSAKIMLDLERVRATTTSSSGSSSSNNGMPQSRGYGFVEFTSHIYALACLRELNNTYGKYYSYNTTSKTTMSNTNNSTTSTSNEIDDEEVDHDKSNSKSSRNKKGNKEKVPHSCAVEGGKLIVEFSLENIQKVRA
jgi:RNA recognition motif-containing protein